MTDMEKIQELYKKITLKMAKHLKIKVFYGLNQEDFDKICNGKSSTAPKTFIKDGNLYLNQNASWSLAIHELLHIAVVEPKYRIVMHNDTQESYSIINSMYPEGKKYRSESATLGLQYHVYKHFGLIGYLYGGFFSGAIRLRNDESNIPKMWRDKGLDLFDSLKIERLFVNNSCMDNIEVVYDL